MPRGRHPLLRILRTPARDARPSGPGPVHAALSYHMLPCLRCACACTQNAEVRISPLKPPFVRGWVGRGRGRESAEWTTRRVGGWSSAPGGIEMKTLINGVYELADQLSTTLRVAPIQDFLTTRFPPPCSLPFLLSPRPRCKRFLTSYDNTDFRYPQDGMMHLFSPRRPETHRGSPTQKDAGAHLENMQERKPPTTTMHESHEQRMNRPRHEKKHVIPLQPALPCKSTRPNHPMTDRSRKKTKICEQEYVLGDGFHPRLQISSPARRPRRCWAGTQVRRGAGGCGRRTLEVGSCVIGGPRKRAACRGPASPGWWGGRGDIRASRRAGRRRKRSCATW